MNTIEDRLSAALHARTDLVQPEDLRAPEVPTLTPTSPWRRPAVYGLLAAACAAAIAVPILVSQIGDERDGAPAPSPAPPGPTGDSSPKVGGPIEVVGLDVLEVGQEWQVELDGGGRDTVSLVGPSDKEYYEPGDVSLVVTTTTGGTQEVTLDDAGYHFTLLKGTMAGPELPALVVGQVVGGEMETYAVYGFVGGELAELTSQVTEPLLASSVGVAEYASTSLTTDNRLVTFEGTSAEPDTADVWQWSIDGSELAVADLGPYCRQGETRWVPCG